MQYTPKGEREIGGGWRKGERVIRKGEILHLMPPKLGMFRAGYQV